MKHDYLQQLFSLDGLVAVVTGASSGIGRSIALGLARSGASVVFVGRDETRLGAACAEVTRDGCVAAWVSADLADAAGVRAAIADIVHPFGSPDILVNSAGVNPRPPLAELDQQSWRAALAVNLEAPYILGQAFGPGMAERGFGRMIHLSSQQAHRAYSNSGAYGVSKGALESLSRSQAEAWSPSGVTSNTLVPGMVITPMNSRLQSDPGLASAMAARTLIGRNGVPEDLVGAAVFLAGRASAYVTGQSVFVDGGFSVH